MGLATSYVGASVSLGAHEQILLRSLGAFLAGYALFLMFQSKFRIRAGDAAALSGGAVSGFFAGMFGMGGAIRGAFLSAFDLPKAVYIATSGAIGLLVDSTRIVTYVAGDATLPRELWYGLALFIPLSFLGAQIARKIVGKIPQGTFRTVVAVLLFAIGITLVLFP